MATYSPRKINLRQARNLSLVLELIQIKGETILFQHRWLVQWLGYQGEIGTVMMLFSKVKPPVGSSSPAATLDSSLYSG